MDLGVGCSNLIGNVVHLGTYNSSETCTDWQKLSPAQWCVAQAFFSSYFTTSSILWIISVVIYIYVTLVATRYAKYVSYPIYVVCYGVPLLVSLWLLVTQKFGYTPQNPSGICGVISYNPKSRRHDIIATVMSINLWLYLTFVLVPVICLAIHCYLHRKSESSKQYYSKAQFWKNMYLQDYKFLLMPLVFFLLRIWSCVSDALVLYTDVKQKSIPEDFLDILPYLTGISTCGQGFANFIIFVVLTKQVRQTVFSRNAWKNCILNQCLKSQRLTTNPVLSPVLSSINKPQYIEESLENSIA
eukprot:Em0006g1019a